MELGSISSSLSSISMEIGSSRRISTVGAQVGNLGCNNDEKERSDRRRSRIVSATDLPPTKTKVTYEQFKDIYSNCIKLSTDNKICSNNAFGLQLIDYMHEVLHQHKEENGTNFQVASCTLDASVKIYGYRVDSVHLDTYRMAGTLGHGSSDLDDGDPVNARDTDGQATDGDQGLPRQRKMPKGGAGKGTQSKVEKNLRNIQLDRVISEEETNLWNVVLARRPISSAFGRGGIDSYILNTYSISSDYGRVVVDPMEQPFSSEPPVQPRVVSLPSHLVKEIKRVTETPREETQLLDHIDNFSFTSWEPPSSVAITSAENLIPLILGRQTDRAAENLDCGDNIVDSADFVEPYVGCNDGNDTFSTCEDNQDENEIVRSLHNSLVQCERADEDPVNNLALGVSQLANDNSFLFKIKPKPDEYSYFDVNADSAGFMKSQSVAADAYRLGNLVKFKVTSQLVSSKSRSRKKPGPAKKPLFFLSYDEVLTKEDMKVLNEAKASRKLATIAKPDNYGLTTFEREESSEKEQLFTLFLMPYLSFNSETLEKLDQSPLSTEQLGAESPNYDEPDNSDADLSFSHDTNQCTPCGNSFMNNLIPQPKLVNRLFVKYAKVAKKLDTRVVKMSIWKLIDRGGSNEEDSEKPVASSCFSQVYERLPNNLPKSVATNLSPQLAFVCLLHLANEKGLSLTNSDDLSDVFIRASVPR